MRVVLVVPPFSASPEAGAAKIKRGKLRPLPPLGPGYIAAVLEAHGHEVALVDSQARELDVHGAVDAIFAEEPDVVGVSCFTAFAHVSYALADAIKARNPRTPVVLGGPHATAFHETILADCPSVDFVAPGEAEHVFAELLDCLGNGRPVAETRGIVFRDEHGNPVSTPPAEPVRRLDELPQPARHIFGSHRYVPLPNQARRTPATTAMTSRGCPWAKCRFCYQGGKYASPYRRRSPENVLEELRHLVRDLGYREVLFWDDNFCLNERWIRRFCGLLDADGLDLTWTVQGRVDTITRDMLHRMAASGCYNIFLGFESGNPELLEVVDKGITLDQIRRAVGWANEAGLEIRGSFIMGLPTETPAMSLKTIDFACELDVDYMVFMPYHVQAGTALEELALREGRVFEPKEFDYNKPSYVPNTYSGPEELAEMIRYAYRRYYLRPRYVARALWKARRPAIARNYVRAFLHWYRLTRRNRAAR